jgi:aspartate racemase
MKIPGIIGGLGPESTIEYYRLLIAAYRTRTGDGSYPQMVVNNLDMQRMIRLVTANDLAGVTAYLLAEIHRLARAGADFGVIAANTPHLVFPALQAQSPIPLLSIVEVTCRAAGKLGLKRLGLFGAKFTMAGRFYPDVFERAGIALVSPTPAEQDYIHERYMGELVQGIIRPETKAGLLAIAERMRVEDRIGGLILGGTELPLILGDVKDAGMPFLDTTQLHVEAIVEQMLA